MGAVQSRLLSERDWPHSGDAEEAPGGFGLRAQAVLVIPDDAAICRDGCVGPHPRLWGSDTHLDMARILVLGEGSFREMLVRGPSAPEVGDILAEAGVTVDRGRVHLLPGGRRGASVPDKGPLTPCLLVTHSLSWTLSPRCSSRPVALRP